MRIPAKLSALRIDYAAVALAITIALGACGGIAIWAVHEREQTIQDRGYHVGANLARVLEEQVTAAVQAVDLTLLHTLDAIQLLPELSDHDPDFEETLRQKLPRLPYVRALFIIGPDGFIAQDTDHPFTPRTNLADREYFKAHVEHPSLGVHIGPPLLSRSTNTWFVSISRRISGPGGGFGGVVVAAVEAQRFASFYRSLELGPSASIALFRRDGTLLLRVPHIESLMGQRRTDIPLFRSHLLLSETGSYRSETAFDGTPRVISYRALANYPLIVTIALAEEAVLAPWRRNLTSVAAGGLALAVLLAAAGIAAVRYRRHYELARERRLQTQHLETLGRMTGGIAHDINNLLAIIASGTRILSRPEGAGAESSRMVAAELADAVARGRGLMAQLLSFAKSHALNIRPVHIGRKMDDLRALLRQAAGAKVVVNFEVAPDIWACQADPVQFDAALLNLAVNARDAMPEGGRLTVAARNLDLRADCRGFHVPAGEYVEICVADTGTGMSPDVVRRAIEPFFSTKGSAGTGLGLSQVYGFVRQVGGDLRIESAAGKGTTVRLLFPRADDSMPAERPKAESPGGNAEQEIRSAGFAPRSLHTGDSPVKARAPEETAHS